MKQHNTQKRPKNSYIFLILEPIGRFVHCKKCSPPNMANKMSLNSYLDHHLCLIFQIWLHNNASWQKGHLIVHLALWHQAITWTNKDFSLTCRRLISSFFCSINFAGIPPMLSWALSSKTQSSVMNWRALRALRNPVKLICISLPFGNCKHTNMPHVWSTGREQASWLNDKSGAQDIFNGLIQGCGISSAQARETPQPCTQPQWKTIYPVHCLMAWCVILLFPTPMALAEIAV